VRASTIGLLIAAVAVVLLVGPPSGSATVVETPNNAMLSGLVTDHFVDGDAGASLLAGSYAGYVRAQDRYDLSLGNPNNAHHPTLDLNLVRQWLSILNHRWPSGAYGLNAGEKILHTSGYINAAYAARSAPAEIGAISEDWEPGFEPEFSFNFGTVLHWASALYSVAHANHRNAIFFVTGRGLGQYSGSWNYGLLASKLDHVTVQTQANCYGQNSQVNMANAVRMLISQFRQYGQPLNKLTVVVSVPIEYNAVSPYTAAHCVETALSLGVTHAEVYWSPSRIPADYAQYLRNLGR
jgi:hypothetical protein